MPTGWPIEARLDLVRELYMAVGRDKRVLQVTSAQTEMFHLVKTILEDGPQHACTLRQTLIGTLRKTAVWPKVRPFLVNNDDSCGRRGCNHSKYYHDKGKGKGCSHVTKTYSHANWPAQATVTSQNPCKCPGLIKKDFK